MNLLERAHAVTPWGTQTNAKRIPTALAGIMPAFITHAHGCRMTADDGRTFIDYRSALGPIILGYTHPDVDDAVRDQLGRGVLFSMSSPLEVELAEYLCGHLPGVEQIRFLKTGHEANGACLRLARAFTGRSHVITCGYHGHTDYFAAGGGSAPLWMNRTGNGVPLEIDDLVTRVPYGDHDALEQALEDHGHHLAAIIMVPYDWQENIARDFVSRAREATQALDALLIFDQVLTGFRLSPTGGQGFFGIVPDLTSYAKAMANGYPISAYGGRRDVMQRHDQVTITTTYAGETLSLAAALVTTKKILEEPIIDEMARQGARIATAFDHMAASLGLPFRSFGLPQAHQFRFDDANMERDRSLRMAFFRGLLERGIFPSEPFLMNASHDDAAVEETVAAVQASLRELADLV